VAAPQRIELELSARSPRALERAWCLARLTLELAGWRVRRKRVTRSRTIALCSARGHSPQQDGIVETELPRKPTRTAGR
jgi:hypothetical protein